MLREKRVLIAWVEGVLRESAPTRVVVDVNGVGYELLVPFSTFAALPDEGKTVALHVHTAVREDAIQLFGFATGREREAFELLLKASRVGPRLAQSILSGIEPDALFEALRDGDVSALRAVPGIGAKLAERISVELRDRAGELAAVGASSRSASGAGIGGDASAQALSALVNLGYPKSQAERAVESALKELGEEAALEAVIREALRRSAK